MSLNLLGLIFNIVGAIMLWRYALPANIGNDGQVKLTKVWGGEQTPQMKKTEKRILRGRIASHIGMFMIIVGFIFQVCSELKG